jgi:hypothetical protein
MTSVLFVAVSIGASFLTPERSIATGTFMSPVVFHFATILLLAIAGLSYTTVVLVGLGRASVRDIADRLGYGICPLAAYLAILASAGFAVARPALGANILALALLLLSRRQFSQRLGSGAGFRAPGCKSKIRYVMRSRE